MRYRVTIQREGAAFVARCEEKLGAEGRGASEAEALERLRATILFDLELCPCDVTTADGLVLEVVPSRGSPRIES
jgi:hypothetical protein